MEGLRNLGLSSIANLLAAIEVAKYHGYGSGDVIVTVATDGMDLYVSEMEKFIQRDPAGVFEVMAVGGHMRSTWREWTQSMFSSWAKWDAAASSIWVTTRGWSSRASGSRLSKLVVSSPSGRPFIRSPSNGMR